MKSLNVRYLAASAALFSLLSTAALISCESEDVSINLLKVVPVDPEQCNTERTQSGPPVTSGAFDLVLGASYAINLAANNGLVNIVAAKGKCFSFILINF